MTIIGSSQECKSDWALGPFTYSRRETKTQEDGRGDG